jgi:hypothetical protein
MKDIEAVIEAAKQHGEAGDPDMEVGDLQVALRQLWKLLSGTAKEVFLHDPEVREILSWSEEEDEDDDELRGSSPSRRRRSGTGRSKARPSASQDASA